MGHVYTLTTDGFMSPSYMRRKPEIIVRVSHPRKLVIETEGMDLVLLDKEPDLPVGKEVKVWLERWFKCETLESLYEKERIAEQKAVEQDAHDQNIIVDAKKIYLDPVIVLLANPLTKNEGAECINELRLAHKKFHATYRRCWGAYDSAMKQKSNDALAVCGVIGEAIHKLSQGIFTQLTAQGINGHVAYAYSPNEGANSGIFSPGKYHFKIETPVKKGRFARNVGDTLCKPSKKFWGLEVINGNDYVTCQSCQDRMLELLDC